MAKIEWLEKVQSNDNVLVIIVDYEHTFTGSRIVPLDIVSPTLLDDDYGGFGNLVSYLQREFPGTDFDEMLIIRNDRIVKIANRLRHSAEQWRYYNRKEASSDD